nr:unnamed protein product [Spirometra erinaceieuropaei]
MLSSPAQDEAYISFLFYRVNNSPSCIKEVFCSRLLGACKYRPLVPSRQSLSCCSFPVFLTTFIIMGLSVSVLGPSVIFFEEISNTWEDEIALIYTARSVGALGGWLLSIAFLEGTPKYCGCLMGVGLSGLTIINLSLAFLRRLWWLMGVFAFQGAFLVVSAQGCLTYVISRGGRRKRQIHQILVFCSLTGYALAPILMIPLTCNQQVLLKDKSSLVMTNVSSAPNHPINPNLHRSRRLAELNSGPTTFSPSLFNNASGNTDTDHHFTPVTMADAIMPVLATSPSPRVPITPTSSSSDEGHKTTSEISTEPPSGSRSPMNGSGFTPKGSSETPIPPLATGNKEQKENPKPTTKSSQIPLHSSDEMSTVPPLSPKTTTTDKDRPLLDNVVSATIMQTTRSTTAIHESSVRPVANSATFPSFSANTTSDLGLPSPNITTKQTEVPKKPSIVDAMHLSQDSRTADGSKTVAKMKELDEDVRLTEVDNDNQPAMPVRPPVSVESPQLAKVKPQPTTTKTTPVVSPSTIQSPQFPPSVNATPPSSPQFQDAGGNSSAKHRLSQTELDSQDSRKPSVVDAVHLKQDHNSADGSDTVVKMKEGVRLNEAQNKPPEMKVEKPFPSPVSTSEGAGQNKPIVSPHGPRVPETSGLPPSSDQQVPSPRGNHPERVISINNETRIPPSSLPPAVMLLKETGNRKNEEAESVTERPPGSLNETKILKQPSVEDEMSYKQRSNDSYSLHSSYTNQWNRFAPKPWNHHLTREQYVLAIQRVYLVLCLLTLVAWFIVLPMTGFYQHLRSVCDRCCNVCLPTVNCPRPLFGNNKHRDMETNFDLEAAEKTGLINDPASLDLSTAPTGRVSPKCFRFEEANDPVSSGGITDSNAGKGGVGFRQVSSSPNFAVLRSPQPTLRNSAIGLTPATSTYLWFNPEPTIWPKISWPRNFWLILSAFLFAGLETTFGAFVHTFTLRTLHWNPCDALWVTAVFWSGNILGRLSCLCLGPSSDMGVTLLQGAIDLTSLHKPHGTSNPRLLAGPHSSSAFYSSSLSLPISYSA